MQKYMFELPQKLIKFRADLGRGTNNFVKLMALKLSLILIVERSISQMQIFGDLMVLKGYLGNIRWKSFFFSPY